MPEQIELSKEALARFLSHAIEDCQDCQGCEDQETQDNQINNVVLVDAAEVGRGIPESRIEAIIVATYDNSVLLRFRDNEEAYHSYDVITDDLGPANRTKLKLWGIDPGPEPVVPNYETGTYIVNDNTGLHLIEVDRVGNTYLVHYSGQSETEELDPETWAHLHSFSDPDAPGAYTAEPGLYYVAKLKRMIEVIPYSGKSYYRYTDQSRLNLLLAEQVPDITRVETDTMEINAALIVEASPQQCEDKPTPCSLPQPQETCCS
jgi:hypothetical protein